jgi:hypothetical protein
MRCGILTVGFVARFRIKAIKTIFKGGVFRSSISLAVFISAGCNDVPGIIADQYPRPSGKTWQVALVAMTAKVEGAAIAVIIKLTTRVAVFFDWSEFVAHWAPQ